MTEQDDTRFWMVVRTDDNGACILVRDGLPTGEAADDLVSRMTERGHKQSFEAIAYPLRERDGIIARRGIIE